MINKPDLHSKVKITVDNSEQAALSIAHLPKSFVIEGVVYYPNIWDDKDSIRLLAPNHTTLHPVIPMNRIISIEISGQEYHAMPENYQIDSKDTSNPSIFQIISSKKDQVYSVVKDKGRWSCNCFAGAMNRPCRHIKQAQVLDEKSKSD